MNLNQTIFDECREEVAKEYGFADFSSIAESGDNKHHIEVMDIADKRAMDRQAEFFRWAAMRYYRNDKGEWKKPNSLAKGFTELELYEIWEGQK